MSGRSPGIGSAALAAFVALAPLVAPIVTPPHAALAAAKSIDEIGALPHRDQKDALDAFLTENPSSSEGRFRIGVWYYEEERLADAVDAFEKALEFDPSNFKALANAALVLDKMKKGEEALALFESFVAKNPRDARAIAYYGEALWSNDRKSEGFDQYRKALSIDPSCSEAHFNMGTAYASMGIYREAIREWNLVVSSGKPEELVSQAKGNITRAQAKL